MAEEEQREEKLGLTCFGCDREFPEVSSEILFVLEPYHCQPLFECRIADTRSRSWKRQESQPVSVRSTTPSHLLAGTDVENVRTTFAWIAICTSTIHCILVLGVLNERQIASVMLYNSYASIMGMRMMYKTGCGTWRKRHQRSVLDWDLVLVTRRVVWRGC
jgi:hypothetical protein